MTTNVKNYREIFFEETFEHLAEVEAGLLGLEHDPDDSALLDQVFRGVHSIKGGAATFGIDSVADFSHSLENHLDKLRTGERRNDTDSSEALLRSVDCLRALVDAALQGSEPDGETSKNIAEITHTLAQCHSTAAATDAGPQPAPANTDQADTHTTTTWRIEFAPGPDAFQNGLDPTLIWRELDGLGELSVQLDDSHLPNLAELDPTRCHLAWQATLVTDQSKDEIEQAFFFHADDAELVIEPVTASPARTTAPTEDSTADSASAKRQTFGDWLVQRRVVSASQMLKALDLQYKNRIPVGQLALREGAMNVDQVFETLEWGSVNGERFGETAISRGFLTADGLAKLLDLQVHELPSICEELIAVGATTAELLEQEQHAFRDAGGVIPPGEEFTTPPPCNEPIAHAASQAPADKQAKPAVNLEMLKQNSELIGDFLSDCREHLEEAEQQALQMEADSTSEEQLHALYRAFHTIKGVASFVGLTQITELAHAAEDVLNMAREGQLCLTGEAFELVLASLDSLRRLADGVPDLLECDESPPADANALQLMYNLKAVATGQQPAAASTPVPAAPALVCESTSAQMEPTKASEPVEPGVPAPAVSGSDPADASPASKAKAHSHDMKETVRVDRSRLDQLVDMIGELVIGEAMVRQEVAELQDETELESVAQLGRTVRELQEMSLSLRMVPIAATFQKMHRIVRDVSRKLGKQVNFQVEGEETELDKTMVDQLGDPLMHMVRNAVDHGVEMPDDRTAAGKPAEGNVTLRAFLRNGNFYIELVDDGRGLDRDRILQKAVERGVVQQADCEQIPDAEVWMLVFAPGFSTAAVVTDVSGRGVGMDVVKRAIEALNGSIEVESAAGQGSVFRVRLPLTMAIVDGLSVSLGSETFILPLVSVVESVRPQVHEVKTVVGRGEVVQVREETIPLVRLHRVFNRPARELDPTRALVVIVESDGRRLAVLVDELQGQVQAVMKSLETNYNKVPGIAGATILGNGEVAFILDVQGIAKLHANTSYGRVPVGNSTIEIAREESE